MPDNPTQLRRGMGRFIWCIFTEKLRRSLRVVFRPFINLWLMARYRCIVHPLAAIDAGVTLGRGCMIGRAVLDTMGGASRIEIGSNTIVYNHCEIMAQPGSTVRIGSCVLFTRWAAVLTGGHVFDEADTPIMDQGITVEDVVIEDDCWIGYGALVTQGVTVGKGSVVAARSVVTRDVEPMSVVGGVPARLIRRRGAGSS